ncbi:galectin-7 [Octodon degus]|uniref:Galectin n=1 Tax=Octodon degus TaxID=10160 RepID=A0A6P3VC03_OCTDE|nr:galectin-7 [Octodon degus]
MGHEIEYPELEISAPGDLGYCRDWSRIRPSVRTAPQSDPSLSSGGGPRGSGHGVGAQAPLPASSRFHVNLLLTDGEQADAALHFNPRMDEAVVVLNSKDGGKWGREERGTGLPFQRGQPFDLLLIATDEGFKAVVGDGVYHHFKHRLPMGNVRLMEVGGDVQLRSVTVL